MKRASIVLEDRGTGEDVLFILAHGFFRRKDEESGKTREEWRVLGMKMPVKEAEEEVEKLTWDLKERVKEWRRRKEEKEGSGKVDCPEKLDYMNSGTLQMKGRWLKNALRKAVDGKKEGGFEEFRKIVAEGWRPGKKTGKKGRRRKEDDGRFVKNGVYEGCMELKDVESGEWVELSREGVLKWRGKECMGQKK